MMTNPFETSTMAAGYARFRPPLHPLIIQRVKSHLPYPGKVARALDVGCGAGLSTNALKDIAAHIIGIDPSESMLRQTSRTAPEAEFIVARAEAIPLRAKCIEIITAAGSLNYVDLTLFFEEAERTLNPGGTIVVYDFSPGRRFRDSEALDRWFSAFIERYPWPVNDAIELNPERLANMGHRFNLTASDCFEIGITLTPAFYLEYMMTETNVSLALRNGESEAAIRSWCSTTLDPIWGEQPREVLFHGYFACLTL